MASYGEIESCDQEALGRQQVTNLVMEDKMQNKAHFPWHHIRGQKEESLSALVIWQKRAAVGCLRGGFCPSILRQKRW